MLYDLNIEKFIISYNQFFNFLINCFFRILADEYGRTFERLHPIQLPAASPTTQPAPDPVAPSAPPRRKRTGHPPHRHHTTLPILELRISSQTTVFHQVQLYATLGRQFRSIRQKERGSQRDAVRFRQVHQGRSHRPPSTQTRRQFRGFWVQISLRESQKKN